MTDQLRDLLRAEADGLDVPPPPTAAILLGGRSRRRARRARVVLAVAASVAVLAGGVVGVDALREGDGRSSAPDVAVPAPNPTGSPGPAPRGPVPVGRGSAGGLPFGAGRDEVVATLTARLGAPDVTVEPTVYARIPGQTGWFAEGADSLSPSWAYRVAAVTCWQQFCVIFGGGAPDELVLRGWELSEYVRWGDDPGPVSEPQEPEVWLADSTTGLGDSWVRLSSIYPRLRVAGGEGASVSVRNLPWRGIFDGVGEWRLSGQWDPARPTEAPPGARITRLSAGEGPEPGCC